jgi:hypothetical protein
VIHPLSTSAVLTGPAKYGRHKTCQPLAQEPTLHQDVTQMYRCRLKAPTFGALSPASLQSCMAQASLSTASRSHLLPAVVAMTNLSVIPLLSCPDRAPARGRLNHRTMNGGGYLGNLTPDTS